jgi:hypothetical protein
LCAAEDAEPFATETILTTFDARACILDACAELTALTIVTACDLARVLYTFASHTDLIIPTLDVHTQITT